MSEKDQKKHKWALLALVSKKSVQYAPERYGTAGKKEVDLHQDLYGLFSTPLASDG